MSTNERLERLWLAHNADVRAYARRRLDWDLADDVVTDVFVIAARKLDDVPEDALPWLLGCARRVIANQRRSMLRRHQLVRRLATSSAPPPAIPGDTALTEALSTLSAGDRELLLLIAWEGLTHAQAAAALDITANAVGVRLHRARKRLKVALETTSETPNTAREESNA